jgi:hypothetical protein
MALRICGPGHPRYSHAPNGRYGSGRYGYGHEMGWDGMGTSSHGTQFQRQARPEILDLIGVGGGFSFKRNVQYVADADY